MEQTFRLSEAQSSLTGTQGETLEPPGMIALARPVRVVRVQTTWHVGVSMPAWIRGFGLFEISRLLTTTLGL